MLYLPSAESKVEIESRVMNLLVGNNNSVFLGLGVRVGSW